MGSKVPPEILNHEASQFFLSTLLDNPNYPKEIFERFTVVNLSSEKDLKAKETPEIMTVNIRKMVELEE